MVVIIYLDQNIIHWLPLDKSEKKWMRSFCLFSVVMDNYQNTFFYRFVGQLELPCPLFFHYLFTNIKTIDQVIVIVYILHCRYPTESNCLGQPAALVIDRLTEEQKASWVVKYRETNMFLCIVLSATDTFIAKWQIEWMMMMMTRMVTWGFLRGLEEGVQVVMEERWTVIIILESCFVIVKNTIKLH